MLAGKAAAVLLPFAKTNLCEQAWSSYTESENQIQK
jgi:hypothetical protein